MPTGPAACRLAGRLSAGNDILAAVLEPNFAAPAYFNTGCWTDHHCHYLTVQDGVIELEEVHADALPPAKLRA